MEKLRNSGLGYKKNTFTVSKILLFKLDYKSKTEANHRGMHCLLDAFVKPHGQINLQGNTLYRFEIHFLSTIKEYYVSGLSEYNCWVDKLTKATGNFQITHKYDVGAELVRGKYGIIKMITEKSSGNEFCLKVLNKKLSKCLEMEEQKNEIEIMKICQHENIVKLYDVYETNENYNLVMEYCSEGDLLHYLKDKNFSISEEEAKDIISQILNGLNYLHQYGIVHRDLKPENILIKEENGRKIFKIADFGLSKIILPNETCIEPYGTLVSSH